MFSTSCRPTKLFIHLKGVLKGAAATAISGTTNTSDMQLQPGCYLAKLRDQVLLLNPYTSICKINKFIEVKKTSKQIEKLLSQLKVQGELGYR